MGGTGVDYDWRYLTGTQCGAEEYYLGAEHAGAITAEAFGKGAAVLGLETIDEATFAHLHAGYTPDGSRRLIQTQNGVHITGIDVSLSAPKSASVAMLGATEEERQILHDAWHEAARAGAEVLQRRARVVLVPVRSPTEAGTRVYKSGPSKGQPCKTQGSDVEWQTAGLVGLLVDHSTARPSEANIARGDPPDLHLHSHLWLANMAVCSDGRIRGINDRGIKRELRTVEAAVQAEFARLIEDRLGWKIDYHTDQRGDTRWEIAGVDPRLRQAHSTRSAEVAALARGFEDRHARPPLPSELRDLARTHRRAKDTSHDHDHAPRIDDYRAAAQRDNLPLPRFEHTGQRASIAEREAELTRRLMAPSGLCREDALFYRESIEPAVLRCAAGLGLSPDQLIDYTQRLAQSPELTVERKVGDDPSRFDLLSTRAVKSREALIVDTLVAKATAAAPAPEPVAVGRAMHRAAHPLDGEQRAAVVAAYLGRGTGTAAVADHVYALACAGLAAQGTAERIGAEAGHTVESFCASVEHGRIRPTERTVLVVDEYITVDTFRMARLLQAAGEARIICVGDERQAQGIGASGWQLDVRDVLEPAGLGPVTLTNVHRQRDRDDRMALAQLREGHGGQALQDLQRRGRLHVADDPAHVDGQVLATYQRLRDEGRGVKDVFVDTDTSNARVDTYNRLIQHDRLRRGELAPEHHLDYVADAPDRHERLYVGDRVAFLAGLRAGDTKVANGAQGEIIGINEARRAATVRLDAGGRILVPVPVEAPTVPIRLAYAGHVAKTQGAEAPVVLVVPGYVHSSLESAYSALTRGSEQIHVYLDHTTHGHDPIATLAARWQAPDPKRSATAQARAYASWVTRPPGWAAIHPEPGKARLRLGENRFGEGPQAGWTPPPMTPRQAGYLADLSRRAGVAVDGGLNIAEASERIAALIAAEGHTPARVPGRQHQRSATFDPYLDQAQAEEAVAAAERASEDLRRPSERIRTPEEIMRSERIRTPEEIMRSERIRSPEEIMRSERIRTPEEIRAEEEGTSR